MNVRRTTLLVALLAACGKLEIGSYPPSIGVIDEDDGSDGGENAIYDGAGSSGEGGGSATDTATSGGAGADGGTGDEHGGGGAASNASNGASAGDGGHPTEAGAGGHPTEAGAGGHPTEPGTGGGSVEDTGWANDPSCYGIEEQCAEFLTCCDPAYVPSQEFTLGKGDHAVDASVTLFYPDVLEVTVGRFARFLEEFDSWAANGHPEIAEGEHLYIQNTGWQPQWPVPASRRAIEQSVTTCPLPTYAMRETNPELPMTCVSWYEAFAFCIWDGKRLLTEAEWELVAKGGQEQRLYPWGNAPEPTPDYASFECRMAGPALDCEPDDILRVGSKPLGMSYDGLRDMGGSVAEWVFDLVSGHYENPCNDCANVQNPDYPTSRVFRGGGYASPAQQLQTEVRNYMEAASRLNFLGFRCARSSVQLW